MPMQFCEGLSIKKGQKPNWFIMCFTWLTGEGESAATLQCDWGFFSFILLCKYCIMNYTERANLCSCISLMSATVYQQVHIFGKRWECVTLYSHPQVTAAHFDVLIASSVNHHHWLSPSTCEFDKASSANPLVNKKILHFHHLQGSHSLS